MALHSIFFIKINIVSFESVVNTQGGKKEFSFLQTNGDLLEKICNSTENSHVKKIHYRSGPQKDIMLWAGYPRSRCIQPSDKHFCSLYNMVAQIRTDPAGE